jgi:hypothetical protein
MLTGAALTVFKAQLLRILNQYSGIEARETQLITDYQVNHNPAARPDDIRQALGALKDDGFAVRRLDDVRGVVWKISPDGHRAAEALILEEGA